MRTFRSLPFLSRKREARRRPRVVPVPDAVRHALYASRCGEWDRGRVTQRGGVPVDSPPVESGGVYGRKVPFLSLAPSHVKW